MELTSKTTKRILFIVAFNVFLYWSLQHFSYVTQILSSIFNVISPFIFGICLAFILNILLRFLETNWELILRNQKSDLFRKIKRPICIVISFTIVIGAILMVLFIILPELGKTIVMISEGIPYYIDYVEYFFDKMIIYLRDAHIPFQEIEIDWDQITTIFTNIVTQGSKSFFDTLLEITLKFFSGIFNIILGIIFAVYILFQKETLIRQTQNVLYAYLSESKVDRILYIARLSNNIFSKFVTGQLIEALILGTLCFLGMSMLSMPYATMVSILVGCTALIPIFGALIGTVIGALVILMVNPVQAIGFVVFMVILQQLEGNIIYPKVVGKSVGLPSIWVLIAVTVGAGLGGVLGMLIGVPICSVLYSLWQESVHAKLKDKKIRKN